MQRRNLVVAIDGPSGSGKSTVARQVAATLDLRYLDTGAMYRAVTWLALQHSADLTETAGLGKLADSAQLVLATDPRAPRVVVEGTDVTDEVRGPAVTAAVSAVSAVPEVRAAMVRRQREIIGDGGIVVEGRDIGTTVAPAAAVKVFLTADPATRAQRRTSQDTQNGAAGSGESSVAHTQADLARRDQADSTRAASPMQQAPDATVIDSSTLAVEAVVAAVVELAERVSAE